MCLEMRRDRVSRVIWGEYRKCRRRRGERRTSTSPASSPPTPPVTAPDNLPPSCSDHWDPEIPPANETASNPSSVVLLSKSGSNPPPEHPQIQSAEPCGPAFPGRATARRCASGRRSEEHTSEL